MYGTSVFNFSSFNFSYFYTELGHISKKMALFSFPLSFALGFEFVFVLIVFVCWLDFLPNTRFSNRSDCILCVKLSLSPRVIFLVVRILLAAHRTLLLFYKLLFVKT